MAHLVPASASNPVNASCVCARLRVRARTCVNEVFRNHWKLSLIFSTARCGSLFWVLQRTHTSMHTRTILVALRGDVFRRVRRADDQNVLACHLARIAEVVRLP